MDLFDPVAPTDDDFAPEVRTWARALCVAAGDKPERLIGNPQVPLWQAYASYAELAIRAKALVEAA